MPIDPEILWLIAGVILILAEFFAPGVIIVFFGVGAIFTAITTFFGWTPDLGSQAAMFAVTSVVLLFGLRRFVKKWFVGHSANAGGSVDDDYTGREARVITALPGRGEDGLVEIKGTNWNARSDTPVAAGETVIIERRQGLTFHVRPRH
ncbi:NfeD family protein [Luteolibacter arcticus]|uniref:NfeD family protein n=1 Tax=Luteolibacter arcticus TaxID=1581411 RepID=A0ABT3GQ77_9BACT|nr:NfeD family protein [Luteolibacter arcticus]MCW1925642.1 NfeD family protein [Luteolibacter arcticus]